MNALLRDEEKDKVRSTEAYTVRGRKRMELSDRFGQLLKPVIKHCRQSRHFTFLDFLFSDQHV